MAPRSLPFRPGVAVTVGACAVAVLHLWLSSRIGGPSVIPDEAGYLGNARWLSGDTATAGMDGKPYYGFGYSLLLVPLYWVIDDPGLLWRAIVAENAAMLATLVPLLYAFARKVLDVAPPTALTAAIVGAVVPAATAASTSALSENLALPLVAATVLALWASLRDGPLWTRLWFGPAVALLLATHPRGVVVVVVAAGTLLLGWWRRLAPAPVTLANLTALGLLTWGVTLVRRRLVADRWVEPDTSGSDLGGALDLLSSGDGWAELARNAVGQAWYLGVGSLGLAALGIWLIVTRAVGRGGGRGDDGGGRPPPRSAERATAGFILAASLGVFATSVAFFTRVQFTDDHLVYGRHNDSFTPLWVAGGLVLLDGVVSRRAVAVRAAGALAVLVGLSAVLIGVRDPLRYGGTFRPFAVPALSWFTDHPDPASFFWRSSIGGVVGLAVIGAGPLIRRRPQVAAVPVVVWFALNGLVRANDVDGFESSIYRDWDLPEQVESLGVTRAALDADIGGGVALVAYQFALPDVDFDVYRRGLGQTGRGRGPFVFAPIDDPDLAGSGARIAAVDEGDFLADRGTEAGAALWVEPGPEQDRLAREERLLPPGFPDQRTDASVLRSRITVVSGAPGGVIRAAVGEMPRLRLRVTHTGRGSPWLDEGSYDRPGRVQVDAGYTALDPDLPQGVPGRGELPRTLEPGDRAELTIELPSLGPDLDPLPPGRYRIDLGVVDRLTRVPSAPRASVVLEITPAR